jgi:hypothetical protein
MEKGPTYSTTWVTQYQKERLLVSKITAS